MHNEGCVANGWVTSNIVTFSLPALNFTQDLVLISDPQTINSPWKMEMETEDQDFKGSNCQSPIPTPFGQGFLKPQ